MVCKNIKETAKLAERFVRELTPRHNTATVVALYGDLGTGKTTFVQALALACGVSEPVQSPTFVIIKNYQLQDKEYKRLVHIDAYRLESAKELSVLGFHKMLEDKNSLFLIEWADRVEEVLPNNHVKIFFTFVSETTRKIELLLQ